MFIMKINWLAHLLSIFLMGSPPSVFAHGDYKEGVVIDEVAFGRTNIGIQDRATFHFPKYSQVRVLEEGSAPNGISMVRLAPFVLHHRRPRTSETIPSLWVGASHIAMFDDMEIISTCWPYRRVSFRDGVVDINMAFDSKGAGNFYQNEVNSAPILVQAFRTHNIIGIKSVSGQLMYVLFEDWGSNLFLLSGEKVETRKGRCTSTQK
jgi:hypothetical protein